MKKIKCTAILLIISTLSLFAQDAQRPFGQVVDHGYDQTRVMPTDRTQTQMTQDVADQFNRVLRHFIVESGTPRSDDKNEFLMVLAHYSGTGPVGPNPTMVCESQGFGMVMIAYMAGAENMMVLSDPAVSTSTRVPLKQRLRDNLPAGLRAQFGADEVTFQVYFDAMFRTMRRFPTSTAMTGHGPSTGSAVNATYAERTSSTATTIHSSYSGTISNPNYLMAWSLSSAAGNGTQQNAALAVRSGAWSDTGAGASVASDGAMDMIYALLLADKQWGGPPAGRTNATSGAGPGDSFYLYWAKGGMTQFQRTCTNIAYPNTTNPLRNTVNGNWAQGANNRRITRPSDFFLTHWKSFAESGVNNTVRSQWIQTIETTNHAVNSGSNPTTGILPDFLWYGADNLWRPLGPSPSDGIAHWNENTANDRLYAWNACRVPWRIGLDVLHHSNDSEIHATVQRLNNSMNTRAGSNFANIRGGQLDGTFGNFSGSAFQAPYLVTAAAFGPANWMTNGWTWARGRTSYPDNYGDYIQVLSMIAASGNWWCPITPINKTHSISASPTSVNFGSMIVGYAQPAEQTVTITNNGAESVTLNALPAVANYTLTPGANWTTAMAPGATRTFTIRLNAGLAIGTYNPRITITGSNDVSVAVTPNATVTPVIPIITILTQPAPTTFIPQNNVTGSLSVAASVTENATLSYQWYTNTSASNVGGTPITGATNATYNLTGLGNNSTTYYFVEVRATNDAVPVRSNPATVMVRNSNNTTFITISQQPVSVTVTQGSISGNLSVTAAVNNGTLTYQWYSNTTNSSTGGSIINGATSATFVIPTDLNTGTYYYYCILRATGAVADVNTIAATVTVEPGGATPPVITINTQPVAATVTQGSISGNLTIAASATEGATVSINGSAILPTVTLAEHR